MKEKHLKISTKKSSVSTVSSSDKELCRQFELANDLKQNKKLIQCSWTVGPKLSKEFFAKIIHKIFFCNMKFINALYITKITYKEANKNFYQKEQNLWSLTQLWKKIWLSFRKKLLLERKILFPLFCRQWAAFSIYHGTRLGIYQHLVANNGSVFPAILIFFLIYSQIMGMTTKNIQNYSPPKFTSKDVLLNLKHYLRINLYQS